MTIFAPAYENGRFFVEPVESELLKVFGRSHSDRLENSYCYYKKGFGFYGHILDANRLFTSEIAAWNYIQKGSECYKYIWNGEF